jgi:hypothetical protein
MPHNEPPLTAADVAAIRRIAAECTLTRAACAELSHGRTVECRFPVQRVPSARALTFRYPLPNGERGFYRTVVTTGLLLDRDCADFLRHRLQFAIQHELTHDNPRTVTAERPQTTEER